MTYEPRLYRTKMGNSRFESFEINYKDSNLWIGIDKSSFNKFIPFFALKKLTEQREALEAYIKLDPNFKSSFSPIDILPTAPNIAIFMADAARKAGTGPMAAVAGAFSEFIGKAIQTEFKIKEIVVENGGDIWLDINYNLILSIYAGNSPLSEKIAIEIDSLYSPLGICTSAGNVGPSISFGNADAVVVACKDAALADAFATAVANNIKNAGNIPLQQEIYNAYQEILSLVIICEGNVGMSGIFKVRPAYQ